MESKKNASSRALAGGGRLKKEALLYYIYGVNECKDAIVKKA
ncbi:hypothetical protein [Herbaspirillum huttiense]|nr:hypothetical protein [Herbaspirillum huttiense]